MKTTNRTVLVEFLFAVIGLSTSKIASCTNITQATVANELTSLGGKKSFPDRPTRKDIFPTALQHYLQLRPYASSNENASAKLKALYIHLGVEAIENFAQGVTATTTQLLTPQVNDGKLQLLRAVFGSFTPQVRALEDYWDDLLEKRIPTPQTEKSLRADLVNSLVEPHREQVLPKIADDDAVVAKALLTLTPREEKVINLRFGPEGTATKTLEEVGEQFAVTRERIREIESKALRKLRRPERAKILKKLLKPYAETIQEAVQEAIRQTEQQAGAQQVIQIADANNPVQKLIVSSAVDKELLAKRIDELEISVRSYNCLKDAAVQTVLDLVQRTEREMLAQRAFGKKTLYELKAILADGGLQFGMIIEKGELVAPEPPDNTTEGEEEF